MIPNPYESPRELETQTEDTAWDWLRSEGILDYVAGIALVVLAIGYAIIHWAGIQIAR